MRKIRLEQKYKKKSVLIDDEYYDFFSNFKWYFSNGYALTILPFSLRLKDYGVTQCKMHHMVMGVFEYEESEYKQRKLEVDHINRNKLDNRKCNLRWVSRSINMRNKK